LSTEDKAALREWAEISVEEDRLIARKVEAWKRITDVSRRHGVVATVHLFALTRRYARLLRARG
jgi:hypothetical protein